MHYILLILIFSSLLQAVIIDKDTLTTEISKSDSNIIKKKYKRALNEFLAGSFSKEITLFLQDESNINKILLYGPPGSGKTELAKALAKASEREFLYLSGNSVVTSWQGSGSQSIKNKFEEAYSLAVKKNTNVLLFIDEIDGFAKDRKANNSMDHTNALLALLEELDYIENDRRICVICATNKILILDDAFLSRMPYKLEIALPSEENRLAIFKYYLYAQPNIDNIFLKKLAYRTKDLSIRDIKSLIDIAKDGAYNSRKSKLLKPIDFDEPIKTIQKNRLLTEKKDYIQKQHTWIQQHAVGLAGLGLSVCTIYMSYFINLQAMIYRKEDILFRDKEVERQSFMGYVQTSISGLGLGLGFLGYFKPPDNNKNTKN